MTHDELMREYAQVVQTLNEIDRRKARYASFLEPEPEPEPEPPKRELAVCTLHRAGSLGFNQVNWLWPGRVPVGKVTLLVGDCGVGKSLVTLDMAARVTTGRGFPPEAEGAELPASCADGAPHPDAGLREPPEVGETQESLSPPAEAGGPRAGGFDRPARFSGREGEPELVQRGKLPGAGAEPGEVLLIAGEDDPIDTIAPRLAAMGADLHRVHYLTQTQTPGEDQARDLDLSRDVDLICEWMNDPNTHERPIRLVVIDPLHRFLRDGCGRTAQSVLYDLNLLAGVQQTAIVVVTHFGKSAARRRLTSDQLVRQTLGSVLIPAAARSVQMLVTDPRDEDRRLLLPGKCNVAAAARDGLAMRITTAPAPGRDVPVWGVSDGMSTEVPGPDAAVVSWEDGAVSMAGLTEESLSPPTKVEEAMGWLANELAGGSMPMTEVARRAQANGISAKTLRRAREALGVSVERVGGLGGSGMWHWRATEGLQASDPPSLICPPGTPRAGHLRLVGSERG